MAALRETGYEATYDFPDHPAPPRMFYLLATVPRSGSTYLSHLLWRSGRLGAPLEYLNHLPAGPYGFAHGAPEEQIRQFRADLRRRTSPNGVFGLKVFSAQLAELKQRNPELLALVRPRRMIYLERRDRLAHAVSLARATRSGVWRKEQETESNRHVDFSARAVDQAREDIERQQQAWNATFDQLRVEPLRLWHEDTVADPEGVVKRVASFLGVTLDPAARIDVPEVREQHRADSLRWIGRYRAGG